jgi:hypothetical protein
MENLDNRIEHVVDAILARWVVRMAVIGAVLYVVTLVR